MHRALERLTAILDRHPTDIVELGIGCLGIGWAAFLSVPGITPEAAPAWSVLIEFMPTPLQLCIFGVTGGLGLYGVLWRDLRARRVATMLGVFIWTTLAVLFCAGLVRSGTQVTPGVLLYLGMAVASAWCYYRGKRDLVINDGDAALQRHVA